MKYSLLLMLVLAGADLRAQKSDFIVIKNRNNRTLRTYFPGSFINADTYAGYTLNGYIQKIKNDSLFVEQQNIYQVPTQFGTPVLDTVRFLIALNFREIYRFNYNLNGGTRYRGNSLLVPKLMLYGGIGYIALEGINTAYRKESLNDGNKLTSMGIAAGVAAAGLVWQELVKKKERTGGKTRVEYIRMTD